MGLFQLGEKKRNTPFLYLVFLQLLTTQGIVLDDAANHQPARWHCKLQGDWLRMTRYLPVGSEPGNLTNNNPVATRIEESFGRPAYNKVAWTALHGASVPIQNKPARENLGYFRTSNELTD